MWFRGNQEFCLEMNYFSIKTRRKQFRQGCGAIGKSVRWCMFSQFRLAHLHPVTFTILAHLPFSFISLFVVAETLGAHGIVFISQPLFDFI